MKFVLETKRLLLRQVTTADVGVLFLMESEPDVLRYVGRKPLAAVDAYRNTIQTDFLPYYDKPGGYGAWAIIEKASGAFVGGCSLRPAVDAVEIGYGLRKPSWGRGYATERVQALVRRAFTELRAVSVVACVTVGNLASIRVPEKVGLQPVGEAFCLPGEGVPSVTYALSKEQFDQQHG